MQEGDAFSKGFGSNDVHGNVLDYIVRVDGLAGEFRGSQSGGGFMLYLQEDSVVVVFNKTMIFVESGNEAGTTKLADLYE